MSNINVPEEEKIKQCILELNQLDIEEISANLAEVAAQHIDEHDVVLLFGQSKYMLSLLKEIKDIQCTVIYVQNDIDQYFKGNQHTLFSIWVYIYPTFHVILSYFIFRKLLKIRH